MALSDDQRAMLRLLAQREQGYEEMAALMGISVEELRRRIQEALAELDRGAAREEQKPPAPPPPDPPAAPAPAPPAAPPPDPPAPAPARGRRRLRVPSSDGAKLGIAAVAAAVVAVVVLLLTLGGGGGDDSTAATRGAGASPGAGPTGGNLVAEALQASATGKGGRAVTRAVLEPAGGGAATGVAIFGRVKNRLALQVVAEGLEPLAKGESYAIWIAASPRKMLPLAASPVNREGVIASRFEVPTELLAFLASETFDEIAITRVADAKLNAALKKATRAKQAPAYTGSPVLRGKITGPIIGAAKRLERQGRGK